MARLLTALVTPVGRALRRARAGEAHSVACALTAPETVTLTSPRFAAGGPIPLRHAGRGRGDNVSPALAWAGLPAGTRQLLLVVEDPDAPLPRPVIHLVALLDPAAAPTGVPDGALAAGARDVRLVPGTARRVGYHGPRPIAGHGVHRYGFHLFALDRAVPDEPAPTSLRALLPLVAGHVLAAGHLVGTQEHP